MSTVIFPSTARVAMKSLGRFRNGMYPDADPVAFLQQEANRIVAYRGKSWSVCAPMEAPPAGGGASRTRWRMFIHTSTHCRYVAVRVLSVPSNNAGNPISRVAFIIAGDPAPSATADFAYGATTADDVPDTIAVEQTRPLSGATLVDLLPDTDYEIHVDDIDNARTLAVCLFEVGLEHTTENGYIANGVVNGQNITDDHREQMTGVLRDAWLRNGAPIITWSSDVDSASPTRTSATIANLIDGVTGSPTAAPAGFTLSLAHRGSLRRGANIPCGMRVYGKCAGVGSGHVYLTNSAGTDVADCEIDLSTEQWFTTGAFDLPAVDGKYDLRFNSDGSNLLTVRAVSLYQLA